MLGVTIGCARCHDHKFDPIPTRDYYRLITTFATTIRSEIDVDLKPDETRAALAKWQVVQEKKDSWVGQMGERIVARTLYCLGKNPPHESGKFEWLVLDDLEIKSLNGAAFKSQGDGSFLLNPGTIQKGDRWVITTESKAKALTGIPC
ncbi:MAG: hypothetical protein CM1200mP29_09300 [Verrucomicrobiota bacterium]|nr:MAG: hypothetical protein CM1200mP29_09300 [Verrucomicrobiota bacterium]